MHPSLAWRSTILQLAWIGAVTALALAIKIEALQYMLVGGIVAWGGALGAKARASVAGGGDGGSGGLPGNSMAPGPLGVSITPPAMRNQAVSPLAATIHDIVRRSALIPVFALAAIVGALTLTDCGGAQAAQQDAVRGGYATDLQLCVGKVDAGGKTQDQAYAESDACRKQVDAKYGVDAGVGGAR